jgi:GH25 family lysozyme M1 (1,4-beta-N-acetylmuramidase)
MTVIRGVDVSSHQIAQFDTSGSAFAIVKATEGSSYINPLHKDQVAHARVAHLIVGHYHFLRPGSMTDQAHYFLQHAGAIAGDLLVADWEDTGVSNADKDAFLALVQQLAPRARVLLYCNRDFWLNRDKTSKAGHGLWIADPDHPAGHPDIQAPWRIHQYGQAHGLDQNVAQFADAAAMRTWATGLLPTPPAPTPPPTLEQQVGALTALVGTLGREIDGLTRRVNALEHQHP